MTIYLVFESSKGRKDLVFASTSLYLAVCSCAAWSRFNRRFTYRVYAVDTDKQPFNVDKLTPLHTECARLK